MNTINASQLLINCPLHFRNRNPLTIHFKIMMDYSQSSAQNINMRMYRQIIRLTNQNQHLHTTIQYLSQDLHKALRDKNKYKIKYKELKNVRNEVDSLKSPKRSQICSHLPAVGSINHFRPHEKDRDPYKLNPCRHQSHIYLTLDQINCEIVKLTRIIQDRSKDHSGLKSPQTDRVRESMGKFHELAQNVSKLINQIKDSNFSKFGMLKQNRKQAQSEIFNHLQSGQGSQMIIKRNYEQLNKQSRDYQNPKKQRSSSSSFYRDSSQWKVLKQIGTELKNWKFAISNQGNHDEYAT